MIYICQFITVQYLSPVKYKCNSFICITLNNLQWGKKNLLNSTGIYSLKTLSAADMYNILIFIIFKKICHDSGMSR